jgi:prepilin-type N-terminal cleavage/methylation domain-containing protein
MKALKAFTLIELLVVIAIIAILAAILFPVFAQAKNSAKSAADLSNVKQLGLSYQMYINDWDDGAIPDTDWTFPTGNTYVPFTWAGWMMPYIKSEALFKAPGHQLAAESWTKTPQNPDLEYANKSYGISVYGAVVANGQVGGWKVSSLKHPSERILLYGVRNNLGQPGGDNGWWVAEAGGYDNYAKLDGSGNPIAPEISRLAFRYNDSMNVVRFDGSAKNRKKNDLLSLMDSTKTPRARGAGDCQYRFYREIYYTWSSDMSCQD